MDIIWMKLHKGVRDLHRAHQHHEDDDHNALRAKPENQDYRDQRHPAQEDPFTFCRYSSPCSNSNLAPDHPLIEKFYLGLR